MLRWVLLVIGLLLVLYTAFAAMVCNFSLGVILPALIGLPLVALGAFWPLWMQFFATRPGMVVKWTLICGYAAFLVSFAIVTGLIVGRIADKPEPGADCVIVLGAAVRGERLSATFKARLDCALEYLRDNPETRVIVTGGQGAGESVTEASAAQQYLIEQGVEPQSIFVEDKSTSTQENLAFSRPILQEHFGAQPRIVLVSSDYHLYRARLVAAAQGLDVETLGNASIPYLLPNFYLREYVAVLGYKLLGRLG